MAFRRGYTATLGLLARAFALHEADGYRRPIVVSGSAVEYHRGGEAESGDLDLVDRGLHHVRACVRCSWVVAEGAYAKGFTIVSPRTT